MSTTDEQAGVEQLEQSVDELKARLEEKEQRIKELEGAREEHQRLQDKVEEQTDRIEKLEVEVKEYREHNEKDKATVKRRVTDLETQATQGGDPDDNAHDAGAEGSQQIGTPLTQIVKLPECVVQKELTANQERARFIAKDILDYATKTPAGFVVTSSDIRTILAAKEDGTPHTETVSRVISFLDRFGHDDIEVIKRRGIRRVVFTEAAANQYYHADAREQEDITGVVMGAASG